MKISEITVDNLAQYLRLDEPSATEKQEIQQMLDSAVSYITSYTGLKKEELDKYEDLSQVVYILVADFFDNRNYYIEGKPQNVNKSVEIILGMHSMNLV